MANDNSNSGGGFNPVGYAIGGAINAIGSAFGGGSKEPPKGNLHLVNPAQQMLYNAMARGAMTGQGDFGFGNAIKQGKSQVQDFLASRGVNLDPNSGAYGGMMGSMIGSASQGADMARRQFAMGLLGTPLQTATITGANMIPYSPSRGMDQRRQWDMFRAPGRSIYENSATPWGA